MNPNDEVRQRLLQYFYDRNSTSTSRFGKKGSAVKISDAKKELKVQFGLTQQQVMSNLTYLIDNKWIKTFDVEKTINVKGGTVPSRVTWYEVTAKGIDKIEGGSQFEPKERYSGINVTATGSNVITLGDGNVVNANFQALHRELNDLKAAVVGAKSLSEFDKLIAAVDIETIKDQLAKPTPNKAIIRQLWSGVEKIAAVAGVVDALRKVVPLIQSMLSVS
jgi:hypothetical protein